MSFQPTTNINIDGTLFEVAKMSPEIQQMVQYFDDWRQQEQKAASRLAMIRSALRDIQESILTTIQRERAEAQRKAEALGIAIAPPAADGTAESSAVEPSTDTQ